MTASPSQSLFASNYSLSAPNSPASPREAPGSTTRLLQTGKIPASPSPLRQRPADMPQIELLGISTALPTPPISPVGDDEPNGDETDDVFTAELPKTIQKKSSVAFSDSDAYYNGTATVVPTPTGSAAASTRRPSDVSKSSVKTSRRMTEGYDGAMEGESIWVRRLCHSRANPPTPLPPYLGYRSIYLPTRPGPASRRPCTIPLGLWVPRH